MKYQRGNNFLLMGLLQRGGYNPVPKLPVYKPKLGFIGRLKALARALRS